MHRAIRIYTVAPSHDNNPVGKWQTSHPFTDQVDSANSQSYKLHGTYPGCSIPRFYRFAPKDRRHLRRCIDRILEWDFERLIVGHSNVIVDNPKTCLRDAYRWL